jgi:hypothetical protein
MTKHPLTDEIILSIADEAYHLPGYQDDMRAAADWQLEQVIEWIEECSNYDLDFHSECHRMIADLKQAMRPQEDN